MDLGISDDAAVVAASSSGLRKGSAKALAEEGANVVINGRYQDTLEETAAELRETAEGEVIPHAADLTDPNACEGLIERAVDEFRGLDHLVTSAGGVPSGAFLSRSDGDWQDAFDLLVMSVVRLCRAAADPLLDGGGLNEDVDRPDGNGGLGQWGLLGGIAAIILIAAGNLYYLREREIIGP